MIAARSWTCCASLLVAGLYLLSSPPLTHGHTPESLAIGQVAPEITGVDVDGKKFQLSDYRGKVVVLDFWGDW